MPRNLSPRCLRLEERKTVRLPHPRILHHPNRKAQRTTSYRTCCSCASGFRSSPLRLPSSLTLWVARAQCLGKSKRLVRLVHSLPPCTPSSPFTVEHLPSVPEAQEDVAEFSEAIRDLAQLTVFSSTFRYILRDIFISTRAILAQTAAAVGEAASEIQFAANTVEPLVDPNNDLSTALDQQLSTVLGEAASNTAQVIGLVGEEVTNQAKNTVITRIQEVSVTSTTILNAI